MGVVLLAIASVVRIWLNSKSRFNNTDNIFLKSIVKTLKRIDKQMVIIHGGGSFGHIKSKEYGLPCMYVSPYEMGVMPSSRYFEKIL